MKVQRIYEFLFNRWKKEVIEEGQDRFYNYSFGVKIGDAFYRQFVKYKLTNKFDGSVKIKKVYLD